MELNFNSAILMNNNDEFIRIIIQHLNNNTDIDILDQSFNEQGVFKKTC